MTEPLSQTPDVLRDNAERVAREAAEHLGTLPPPRASAQVGDGAVWTKSSPTDVVTESDASVERFLRARLAELRPGEPVFGEEMGDGGRVAAGDASAARWVLDPIDGTVNYLYGLPWYAISVAAVRDGRTLAGAVAEPASGRLWSAALGGGATCDGVALRVSTTSDAAQALVGTGFSYRAERRERQARMVAGLLPQVRDVRRAGSAALDLCAVAAGWLDGYVEHGCHWWDWAAAALVASEAGAVLGVAGGPDDLGPGAPGTAGPGGLGADVTFAAAPGVAAALADLAREHGAADV
jgi:myo-inositol-1(or 4)-monophosphatase